MSRLTGNQGADRTNISVSSSWKTTRLPLRLWLFLVGPVPSTMSSTPSYSADGTSSFSKLYVPTIKKDGCEGQNSMQLGGRLRVRDLREVIDSTLPPMASAESMRLGRRGWLFGIDTPLQLDLDGQPKWIERVSGTEHGSLRLLDLSDFWRRWWGGTSRGSYSMSAVLKFTGMLLARRLLGNRRASAPQTRLRGANALRSA